MTKQEYARAANTFASSIDIYSKLENALNVASRRRKARVILGEANQYIVTAPAAAEKLAQLGYSYA